MSSRDSLRVFVASLALSTLGAICPAAGAEPAPLSSHEFDIVVQQGKRISGPAVLKVQQGDDVVLQVTTDTADELHLHGYNLLVKLLPNRAATLHFTAKLTGRFTYELHKSDLELGALEVYPR
jgi:heme/copper-type cytochrome/quinol oxidase subunit 2